MGRSLRLQARRRRRLGPRGRLAGDVPAARSEPSADGGVLLQRPYGCRWRTGPLAEHGLVIPKDLSVVGFDDQRAVAESLWPGLTTAALPHFAMGEWAVSTLLKAVEKTEHDEAGGVTLPCELVRRASVGPPSDVPPRVAPKTSRRRSPNAPRRSRSRTAAGKEAQ